MCFRLAKPGFAAYASMMTRFCTNAIAARLLSKDLVGKVIPVQVAGDRNCMFHAVGKALEVLNDKVTGTSDRLQGDASVELGKNAQLYARQLWQHSMQTTKSTHDSYMAIALVQSCLSTAALEAFEKVTKRKQCQQP